MCYLDNAATTFPKPQRVNDLLNSIAQQGVVSPGRGSHALAHLASDAVSRVRHRLARFFGAPGDNRLAFCFNATDALNLAIKGFLDNGDHVIISSMEHNSVLRPLRAMQRKGFITLDIAQCDKNGCLNPQEIISRFNKSTKLVIVSHASNVTGTIQPVDEIGRAVRDRGAYLLVDAAQTAGILPINMDDMCIDMLAFTGHKNLFGLQGTGGLAIGNRIGLLRPFREGGTGINSITELQPNEWPEAFEAGTPNVPGILSIGEGLQFIEDEGIAAIRKKGAEQLGYLWNELSAIEGVELHGLPPGSNRISVLSFSIRNWEPDDVGSVLNHNHGIYVRTGLHCSPLAHQTINTYPAGTVRLSPGYFTASIELETVVRTIRTMAKTLLPF
ncbi:MAG: aminotransferase class V-fold PLP-dependent enzyme [Nitrospiraceae bacterium]|nr:aminotransferase class V-fold PLP-dependent enzyme [Nitrospiraceae bacterium]